MQSSLVVVDPAPEYALLTLYEAKLLLKLTVDTTNDDLLDLLVHQTSDEIALYCNRVFAKETVIETFREFGSINKIYLSRYPVTRLDSVTANGVALTSGQYELDTDPGRLMALGTSGFTEPVVVKYEGGYECPFEVPAALRKAAMMLARESYYQTIRGDATVRMIGHKESRIIYFDPNIAARAAGKVGAGSTPAQRAVRDLITCFVRVEV